MMILRGVFLAVMILLATGVSGCGGGGAQLSAESHTTTLGQELKDLKDAYDRGILTEKEYNDAKKKIMEKRTQ